MHALKILMVSSMPNSARPFRFDRRHHPLTRRLQPAIQQGVINLAIQPATLIEQLESLLRRNLPDILHIVCHGTDEGDGRALSFEDRRCWRSPVSAARLGEILGQLKARRPVLVILEACNSRPIGAELVAAGAGAVIAMEGDADAEAGARFFGAFYQAIAAGRRAREAFAEARRDLELLSALAIDTPVLLGDTGAFDARIAEVPRVMPRGIALDGVDERVSRSAAHGPACPEFFGRDHEHAALVEATAPARRRGPVVLRGPAGVGKTALLRSWLDGQQELGWYGFSRVFTWSFDASQRGPGVGDVHAFLEEALFFFGAPPRAPDGKDPTPEAYLRGLQLGRVIRDEPALLVLDAVPLLPRGTGNASPPALESLVHPALAALLRESTGGAALCVLAARDAGEALGGAGAVIEVGGLDDAEGAEFLWRRGMVDDDEGLKRLSASLRGEPLALELCVRSFATASAAETALARDDVPGAADPLTRILAARTGELDDSAREALAVVALHEGRQTVDEAVVDAAKGRPVARMDALRPLVRAGIARVERPSLGAELVHSALVQAALDLLGEELSRHADLLDRDDPAPATTLADVHRLAAIATLARRVGKPARARAIYKELICRAEATGKEQSMVARTLGAVAEDLMILGGFFAVDERGTRRWDTLADGGDDEPAAFIFHRVALALRHLGRLDESVAPMQRACERYSRLGLWERAATCANDLAELQEFRGDLEAALDVAKAAVRWSQANGDSTTRFLTLATRGHVLHLRGDLDGARRDFEDAERPLKGTSAPFLFSRPGFQYWTFLVDEVERRWRGGQPPDEAALTRLRARLADAADQHADPSIAPVSVGLDALAAGRLANLEIEIGRRLGDDPSQARRAAMSKVGLAVAVFRSQHHLWMLPQALCERARMRRLLEDPVSASLDLDEAEALATNLCLPLDRIACLAERANLCVAIGRGPEAGAHLDRARTLLAGIGCSRLDERAGFAAMEIAGALNPGSGGAARERE